LRNSETGIETPVRSPGDEIEPVLPDAVGEQSTTDATDSRADGGVRDQKGRARVVSTPPH